MAVGGVAEGGRGRRRPTGREALKPWEALLAAGRWVYILLVSMLCFISYVYITNKV